MLIICHACAVNAKVLYFVATVLSIYIWNCPKKKSYYSLHLFWFVFLNMGSWLRLAYRELRWKGAKSQHVRNLPEKSHSIQTFFENGVLSPIWLNLTGMTDTHRCCSSGARWDLILWSPSCSPPVTRPVVKCFQEFQEFPVQHSQHIFFLSLLIFN